MSEKMATVDGASMPPAELMVWQRDQFTAIKAGLAAGETMKIEGKPYIKRNGWRMVAAGFNVNLELVKDNEGRVLHNRMEAEDDIGKYYVHTYVARATLPSGKYAECEGACSSRDAFFAKSHGQWKPQSQIDEADIIATAQTVAYNRAISDLVGGAEVSAEEMMGKDDVSFKKPSTEETVSAEVIPEGEVVGDPPSEMSKVDVQKAEIREMLEEMCSVSGKTLSDLIIEFTEFPDKDDPNKMVGGKNQIRYISDRATPVTHRRVTDAYKRMKERQA